MRLISCHIEGFGKFSDRSFDFGAGLTVFNEENGFGKTTLSAFIKAMLYGLEGYRRNTKEFTDRQKYYPFGDSRFGGSLTFSYEGKEYTVTRFFGEKSETDDTLSVTHLGILTDAFAGGVGETLLGLDKASFERVAFINAEDTEIGTTDTVNRMLGGVDAGEEASFERAVRILDDAAKEYKKSRGADAKISLTEKRVVALEERVRNLRSVRGALSEKYKDYETLERASRELNGKITAAQKLGEQLAHYDAYDRVEGEIAECDGKLKALTAEYSYGLPTEAETEKLRDALDRKKSLSARLEGRMLDGNDLIKLEKLSELFADGVPSESELVSVDNRIEEYRRKGYLLEDTAEPSDEERELLGKFSGKEPSAERLSELDADVKKYSSLSEEFTLSEPLSGISSNGKSQKNKILYALGFIMLALGAALCLVNGLIGVLTMTVGAALCALGMAFTPRKKATAADVSLDFIRRREALHALETKINATLFEYGYNNSAGVSYNYASLCADLSRYTRIAERINAQKEREKEIRVEYGKIGNELKLYFERYSLAFNPSRSLSDIRALIRNYRELLERQKSTSEKRETLISEKSQADGVIIAFSESYGIRNPDPIRILTDLKEIKRLQGEIAAKRKSQDNFRTEKGLTERPTAEGESLDTLNLRLDAIRQKMSVLQREIDADENLLEEQDRIEDECVEARILLSKYKHDHKLLVKTREILEEAENNLKERYVKPLADEFKRLEEPLGRVLGERVTVTGNYELRFEGGGELRSDRHLSTGERSIAMLCYRLALIKNVYRDKEIFVILDDPFTGLDKEKMERVSVLLRALSCDMQIIYFTCHDSRAIDIR